MVLTIEDSIRKSSRSKADLFEVIVTINLSQYYGLNLDGLIKDRNKLEQEISKFMDGDRRIKEQYKRAEILTSSLVRKLDTEVVPTYGKPSEIKWIGRKWQEEATLSDIDLGFKSGNIIGISLKSTRKGGGTQKNIGYGKLKKLLGVNIDRELKEMWDRIREDLREKGDELSKIAEKSQTEIKEAKYKFPPIQEMGKKYGFPVQKLAVDQSIALFNALSRKRKLIFLEEIFGIGSARQLLNALVEGETPRLNWNKTAQALIKGDLLAKKLEDKSYKIIANGKPLVRLQASFTNGIGLSAFCERAFLLTNY